MATQVNKQVDAKAKSGETNEQGPTFLKRIMWFILIAIIPVVVAVALIGVALQIVGVPVWQTTKSVLGINPQSTQVSSVLQVTKQDLATVTAKERLDSSQNAALQQQIRLDQQQIASLLTKSNQMGVSQQSQSSLKLAAKNEAQVLSQMDPDQAAGILAKMQIQQAAAAVASMSPADSGAILSQMAPTTAGSILSLAAKLQSSMSQQSANNTANTSGP